MPKSFSSTSFSYQKWIKKESFFFSSFLFLSLKLLSGLKQKTRWSNCILNELMTFKVKYHWLNPLAEATLYIIIIIVTIIIIIIIVTIIIIIIIIKSHSMVHQILIKLLAVSTLSSFMSLIYGNELMRSYV